MSCDKCIHWREKSSVGNRAWGVCPNISSHVRLHAKGLLSLYMPEQDVTEVMESIRTAGDFMCNMFNKAIIRNHDYAVGPDEWKEQRLIDFPIGSMVEVIRVDGDKFWVSKRFFFTKDEVYE